MEFKKNGHFVSVVITTINRSSLAEVIDALNNETKKSDEIIVMQYIFRR